MSLNPDKFTVLPGGMRAGVLHMNGRDMVHHSVLGDVLCTVIEHEAKAHQATFHAAQFNKIIDAVQEGKISAYFILAGWENCRPKIAGASIEFPTVITEWDGQQFNHYAAIYGEDTCLLSTTLKSLIQQRPHGKTLPQGLGAFFEHERIKRWTSNEFGDAPLGASARGRVGEYSAHSSAMIKLMTGLNARLGTEQDGTILEFNGLTQAMKDKWKLPVEIKDVPLGASTYPNIFLTQWSGEGGQQQIVASFTNGISTFTGDPITRVQITSNGNLPNPGMLQNVLASLLAAGEEESQARRWRSAKEQKPPHSPAIPLHGSNQEIYAALIAASQHEILLPHVSSPLAHNSIWGNQPSLMRIHALQEPAINRALRTLGAATRTLGPHPMFPAVIDFKNIPTEALNFQLIPSNPTQMNSRTNTLRIFHNFAV